MKQYFVCADVHSYYDELMSALHKAGFDINNKNHVFVSLGDLLDRGNKTLDCLNFVNSLSNDRKILIRGNHEDLIEDIFRKKRFDSFDFSNGTVNTIRQLNDLSEVDFYLKPEIYSIKDASKNYDLKIYLNSLVDYYKLDRFIFVHGWIPENLDLYSGDWSKARWFNGYDKWLNNCKLPQFDIVCGHWHCSYANYKGHNRGSGDFEYDSDFSPFIDDGIVCIDSCVAYTGFINCIVIENGKIVYKSEDSK